MINDLVHTAASQHCSGLKLSCPTHLDTLCFPFTQFSVWFSLPLPPWPMITECAQLSSQVFGDFPAVFVFLISSSILRSENKLPDFSSSTSLRCGPCPCTSPRVLLLLGVVCRDVTYILPGMALWGSPRPRRLPRTWTVSCWEWLLKSPGRIAQELPFSKSTIFTFPKIE